MPGKPARGGRTPAKSSKAASKPPHRAHADRPRAQQPASAAGPRSTRQRQAIRDALERSGAPLSPREVLDEAGKHAEGLGLATVYRTLKLLVDAGEVQPVEIPGDAPRYELAGKGHHHHFHCRTCKRVFELQGCCGHFDEMAPRGFRVEGHELTIFGACSDCAARP